MGSSEPDGASTTPSGGGRILVTLILVAAVANLNLSVANVALPSIGAAFDSSQTVLNLIAVGYSLGLAASVLYLGAVGDRYGRKMLLLLGVSLAIPASLLAAYAPSDEVLFLARLIGGVSAGMAYPDHPRLDHRPLVRACPDQVDRPLVREAVVPSPHLGPLVAGALLLQFWWGSVFLITLAAGRGRAVHGLSLRAQPRQRDHRARRQSGWDPFHRAGVEHDPRHQLRPGAGRGDSRVLARHRCHRLRGRLHHQATPGARALSTTWTSPSVASSGSRRSPGSSSSDR